MLIFPRVSKSLSRSFLFEFDFGKIALECLYPHLSGVQFDDASLWRLLATKKYDLTLEWNQSSLQITNPSGV
jgi:hypothetical protein